ncbi:ankyrin repeat and LEM domain-containing protein 1-like [Lingula anatina]|uniref:Ankyrin repeat and LEM domain-containing protein 1-like n=1 Tax=Lingula anatina TaxID=7574 RepID=A0A1S3HF24_LINAN|nr:ankyrin repeat and LEM domain-containing protein 1-like [Lingula anatina]|eukprot:XP_013384672.1 ankyrin repeat and LEM domain-containing protein 1-like [Lingula anatina]
MSVHQLSELLLHAIQENRLREAGTLLKDGADPNRILIEAVTPFHLAVGSETNAVEFTRLLLQYGANPNVRDTESTTPCHVAAAYGKLQVLRLLVSNGGDPFMEDMECQSALDLALLNNHTDVAEYIHSLQEDSREELQTTVRSILNQRISAWELSCLSLPSRPSSALSSVGSESRLSDGHSSNSLLNVSKLQVVNEPRKQKHRRSLRPVINTKARQSFYTESVNRLLEKFSADEDIFDVSSPDHPFIAPKVDNVDLDDTLPCNTDTTESICDTRNNIDENLPTVTSFVEPSSLYQTAGETCLDTFPAQRQPISMKSFNDSTSQSPSMPNKHSSNFPTLQNLTAMKSFSELASQHTPTAAGDAAFFDSLSNRGLDSRHQKSEQNDPELSLDESSESFHTCESDHEGPVTAAQDDCDGLASQLAGALSLVTKSEEEDVGRILVMKDTSNKTSPASNFYFTDNKPGGMNTSSSTVGSLADGLEFGDHSLLTPDHSVVSPRAGSQCSSVVSSVSSLVSEIEEWVHTEDKVGASIIEMHILPEPTAVNSSVLSEVPPEPEDYKDWNSFLPADSNQVQIPAELAALSNEEVRRRLFNMGDFPGPVMDSTRMLYLRRLARLLHNPDLAQKHVPVDKPVYKQELALALKGNLDMSVCEGLEQQLCGQFASPDPAMFWREGIQKSSFNYMLLDPRVTKNLPCRARNMNEADVLQTFIAAIFYIGKGKKSRGYSHFFEALEIKNKQNKKENQKVKHILEIWEEGLGVVSLHVFNSIIPVEAYTREAAMIDAIGLDRLTNIKKGDYYGKASTWTLKQKRLLGTYLLKKALQIFLIEGERQIRPGDLKNK